MIIIGIDFGTSTTVVKYKVMGNEKIFPIPDLNHGNTIIPSVILKYNDGRPTLYGDKALGTYNGISNPELAGEGELIKNFKIDLTSKDPEVREKSKSLIKEFLAYVYSCFSVIAMNASLDTSECEVYVSYPAKWIGTGFGQFIADTIHQVGFPGKIHGISEPAAAVQNALKYHLEHLRASRMLVSGEPLNILMLDMGAGTSDIYIFPLKIEVMNGKIRIPTIKGTSYPSNDDPAMCGGSELDPIFQKIVIEHLKKALPGFEDYQIQGMFNTVDAKVWKENVSDAFSDGRVVSIPQKILNGFIFYGSQITRDQIDAIKSFTFNHAEFEGKTKEHWKNLYKMIESAITLHKSRYGVGAEDIDLILLTGGHSSWYVVPKLFNGEGIGGMIGVDHTIDDKEVKALHFTKIERESWRIFRDALPHESVANGLTLFKENIDIADNSPNNVWVRFTVNDKSTDYKQVLEIGDRLGFERPEETLKLNFGLSFFYNIKIEVLTGRNKETASHWEHPLIFSDFIKRLRSIFSGNRGKVEFYLSYIFTCLDTGTPQFKFKLRKDNETSKELEVKIEI